MRKRPGRPRDPNSSYPRRITISEDQEKSAEEIQKFFALPTVQDAYRYGFEVYVSQVFPKVKQLLANGLNPAEAQAVVTKELRPPPQIQSVPPPVVLSSAEVPAPSRKAGLFNSLKNR